jgi:hypothetical protein
MHKVRRHTSSVESKANSIGQSIDRLQARRDFVHQRPICCRICSKVIVEAVILLHNYHDVRDRSRCRSISDVHARAV